MPSYVDRISNVYLRRRMSDQGSLHERSDKVGKIEVIIKGKLKEKRKTIQVSNHADWTSNVYLRRRMSDQGPLHQRSDKVGKIEVIIKG